MRILRTDRHQATAMTLQIAKALALATDRMSHALRSSF